MDKKEEIFEIDGMMCAGCASGVEKLLIGISGVYQVKVNLEKKNVSVSYDADEASFSAMRDVLKKDNFKLSKT